MKQTIFTIAAASLLLGGIEAFRTTPLVHQGATSNQKLSVNNAQAPSVRPSSFSLFSSEGNSVPSKSTESPVEDEDDEEDFMALLDKKKGKKKSSKKEKKQAATESETKTVLEPEVVIYEGAPSWTEVVIPAISIFTVIGLIPFAASVSRQAWVKYKITSRRISVTSGIGGKDTTEIVYNDIKNMKYAFRSFGLTGDLVMTLRDGAMLELRSLPKFEELYAYILSQCREDCQETSDKLPGAKEIAGEN